MDTCKCILSCFVLICGILHTTSSAKLPNYIKPCKNDAKLNDCALKNGRDAIPKLVLGDPKFKIPKLDPFDIEKINLDHGSNSFGLKLYLTKCKLIGLKNAQFVDSKMDLAKRHIEWNIKLPKAHLYSDYRADGKILVLPITGNGKANVTLMNLDIKYSFDFDLQKRNGKEYVHIPADKADIAFNTTRLYLKFENLFNGDKLLGDNMNTFLDENWKEVLQELGTPLIKSLTPVFTLIISNIAKDIPYNEIFLK